MKDRRKTPNPSGCRVNPRSTHWLGKQYARLEHTGTGVVSAVRLPQAIMPSEVMVNPDDVPRRSAKPKEDIAPPAIVAPPSGDSGASGSDKTLREQQVEGPEKRPESVYSGKRPTWPFDAWQFDRALRADPENLWSIPDPRLQYIVDNESRKPSRHLRNMNLNPYGYMKRNRMPFISDRLTVDFRPYTPYQENENRMERRIAYVQQAFETFKEVTQIETAIVDGSFEIAFLSDWTDAVVAAAGSDADSLIYGNVLQQFYELFPDEIMEDGPFFEAFYERGLVRPFDVFCVHAVACMLFINQYDTDELYASLQADEPSTNYETAGDPVESYNEASARLIMVDKFVSSLSRKRGNGMPDIANLLLGGTYTSYRDHPQAILTEFYMSLGTDFRTH